VVEAFELHLFLFRIRVEESVDETSCTNNYMS